MGSGRPMVDSDDPSFQPRIFSLRESVTVEIESQSCFKVPMQYDNVRKVADAFTDTEFLSKQGCDGGLISKSVIMQL
jgi:hypothetical protein